MNFYQSVIVIELYECYVEKTSKDKYREFEQEFANAIQSSVNLIIIDIRMNITSCGLQLLVNFTDMAEKSNTHLCICGPTRLKNMLELLGILSYCNYVYKIEDYITNIEYNEKKQIRVNVETIP